MAYNKRKNKVENQKFNGYVVVTWNDDCIYRGKTEVIGDRGEAESIFSSLFSQFDYVELREVYMQEKVLKRSFKYDNSFVKGLE